MTYDDDLQWMSDEELALEAAYLQDASLLDPDTYVDDLGAESIQAQDAYLQAIVRGMLWKREITPIVGEADVRLFSGIRFDLLHELAQIAIGYHPGTDLEEYVSRKLSPASLRLWQEIRERIPSPTQEIESLKRNMPPEVSEREEMVFTPLVLRRHEDLPEVAPSSWRVDRLLPDEGFVIFAGHPGAGKSILCMDLSIRLAAGQPFLGHATEPCAVAYIEAEGGKATFIRRWQLLGIPLLRYPIFSIYHTADLSNRRTLSNLRTLIADEGIRVLILDPLAILYTGPENDNAAVRTFLATVILPLVEEAGLLIMAIHHLTKPVIEAGKRAEEDVFSIRGASAWVAHTDAAFLVTGSCATCCTVKPAKVRNEMPDTIHWKLDDLRGVGRDQLVLRMTEPTKKPSEEAIDTMILEYLMDKEEPQATKVIADGIRRSHATVIEAMRRMASSEEGSVEADTTRRGIVRYKLRESSMKDRLTPDE